MDVICPKVINKRKARVHRIDHKFLLHRQIEIITVAPTTKLWHLLQQMNISATFEKLLGRNAVNGTTIIPIRQRNFSMLFRQVEELTESVEITLIRLTNVIIRSIKMSRASGVANARDATEESLK